MTRVALLGFGTVGSAVARRLTSPDAPSSLSLTHVLDRRAESKRAQFQPSARFTWTSSIAEILDSDADVVVEALGGLDPAAEWVRAALERGKSVVTANKQLVARQGWTLWKLAARQGRQLRFEAAVGGAMPIIRTIADGLAGDRVTRITAILNGTTNTVLSAIDDRGCSVGEAIVEAQTRGLAERDPAADIDGRDAGAKLAILCGLAFGLRIAPEDIPTRSASSVTPEDFATARQRGGTIRQLAHAEYDRARRSLTARVAPEFVGAETIFARAIGPQNAALIAAEHCGEIGISGVGAGGDATAVAIVGDLLAIARDRAAIVPAPVLIADFTFDFAFDFSLSTFNFPLAEAV